jgi:hypothetical protein
VTVRPLADARFRGLLLVVVGVIAWLGVLVVGWSLWNAVPRAAGFDWELIVEAGRRVADGFSPYDPALLAGPTDLAAIDLFYSYPPPVAQAVSLIAGAPSLASLLALDGLAVLGAVLVAVGLARASRGRRARDVVVPVIAILPLLFPFTVALVFGNVDVLYPFVYGAVLIAATSPGRGLPAAAAGGAALGVATVAKIHPAGLGLWLLVRGARERRAGTPLRAWAILGVAIATGVVITVASLVAGGVGPWLDYGRVIGVAAGADVAVRANIAPAAQVAMLAGLDPGAARLLYGAVLAGALAITVLAAWSVGDTLLALAIGGTMSLVLLPITWYHYPSVLIPFAIAALGRSTDTPRWRQTALLVAGSGLVTIVAVALPVLVWLAVVLVLVAVAASRPGSQPTAPPAPATGVSSAT